MTQVVQISRRAQARLRDIASWTIQRFGNDQAKAYEDELLSRIAAIENSTAHIRTLDRLTGLERHREIHIVQAGMHLFLMQKIPDGFLIAGIAHSRTDFRSVETK